MAIEPLGSMTVVQAQAAQKAPDFKMTAENKDVAVPEQNTAVDTTTAAVTKTERKESNNENTEERGKEQQLNSDKIKKAVEQLNKNMPHSEAIFGFHDGTNRVTIKIIDKDTREVIKELPPEKTLDMIAKVWEMAGIMVDEKR